jgi:hypothetical protein
MTSGTGGTTRSGYGRTNGPAPLKSSLTKKLAVALTPSIVGIDSAEKAVAWRDGYERARPSKARKSKSFH